jgi:hypothetical protein
MINIPFNRCVVVTTLNLAQITDRLQNAIYDPHFVASNPVDRDPQSQYYQGKIQGFKFSATRIISYKDFYLPIFLLPTIEGKIDSLYHGYKISLTIKVHNITVALLLTWLAGLFLVISTVLENILTDAENYQYSIAAQMVILCSIAVLTYFYFVAYRETKFFKALFIKGFTVATQHADVNSRPSWSEDFQFQEVGHSAGERLSTAEPVTGWLRKNLPSFPNPAPDASDGRQMKQPLRRPESRDLLQQNLPSFPKLDCDD